MTVKADDLVVRPLRPDERKDWEPLWQGYLTFYQATQAPDVTDLVWSRIHDPSQPMFARGAFAGGKLVGIVHYLFHRTFWTAGDYCYLQDLFVDPSIRGNGVGAALIAAVEQEARKWGASRMHWLTREENAVARGLYDKVAERSGFIQYRKIF
jgi:GNAT superfamily N-acetyltransferase